VIGLMSFVKILYTYLVSDITLQYYVTIRINYNFYLSYKYFSCLYFSCVSCF